MVARSFKMKLVDIVREGVISSDTGWCVVNSSGIASDGPFYIQKMATLSRDKHFKGQEVKYGKVDNTKHFHIQKATTS